MLPADCNGERAGFLTGQAIARRELQKSGDISRSNEAFERVVDRITNCCATSAGACPELTTGNTLAVLTEALGFALPGSSTSPGVSAEKIWHAKETGEKIVELAAKDIKPSDIFNLNSLKNTIAVDGGWSAYGYLESWLAKSKEIE